MIHAIETFLHDLIHLSALALELVGVLIILGTAIRTGIAKQGEWARVEYKGQILYCINNYLMKVE